MLRSVLFSVILGLGLGALACSANIDALRARAAFDFKCPAEQLQLQELSSGNPGAGGSGAMYGVTGCGHRSAYVYTHDGSWLMNSDSEQKKEPNAPPSPATP